MTALEQYGQYLDGQGSTRLDVKGYGWVAAFPFPNVTVQVFESSSEEGKRNLAYEELPDEDLEAAADKQPARFDFLGKEIDSGFRTGKFCSADKLSLSVELAWLITKYGDEAPMKGIEFTYSGRQYMKGVLNDRPYPIITIDVERSAARRTVRERERTLLPSVTLLKPLKVHDFLESFMDDEGIIRPWLQKHSADALTPQYPHEYRTFADRWKAIDVELTKRLSAELQAADQDNQIGEPDDLSAEVTEASDKLVERVTQQET